MQQLTHKSGQAFYNLGKSALASVPLPIPSPSEQEKIVQLLDKFDTLIDDLAKLEREDLDREFAKQIEAAILQAATRGQLTKQRPEEGTGAELLQTIDSLQRKVVKGRVVSC